MTTWRTLEELNEHHERLCAEVAELRRRCEPKVEPPQLQSLRGIVELGLSAIILDVLKEKPITVKDGKILALDTLNEIAVRAYSRGREFVGE